MQYTDRIVIDNHILIDTPFVVEYRVMNVRGRGSFGTVYHAIRLVDNLHVAIKLFSKKNSDSPQRRSASEFYFRQECSLLRSFKHPNILRFYDFYENKEFIYLIVEYCEGGDLKQFLNYSPSTQLCEKQVGTIIKGVLSGLEYLHTVRNVIHRDIKLGTSESNPANVLLRRKISPPHGTIREEDICIGDFGLSTSLTLPFSIKASLKCGTKAYHSPEQLSGKLYSYTVDIFAVSIIMNFLLFREHPFMTSDGKLDIEKMKLAEWNHLETADISEYR